MGRVEKGLKGWDFGGKGRGQGWHDIDTLHSTSIRFLPSMLLLWWCLMTNVAGVQGFDEYMFMLFILFILVLSKQTLFLEWLLTRQLGQTTKHTPSGQIPLLYSTEQLLPLTTYTWLFCCSCALLTSSPSRLGILVPVLRTSIWLSSHSAGGGYLHSSFTGYTRGAHSSAAAVGESGH